MRNCGSWRNSAIPMKIEPWKFQEIDTDRIDRLSRPFAFEALIDVIYHEMRTSEFDWEPGLDAEVRGKHRPVFLIDVSEPTFDRFFNSAWGYRGKFAESAEDGQAANAEILARVSSALVSSVNCGVAFRNVLSRSLTSEFARVWISERDSNLKVNDVRLLEQLMFDRWLNSARDSWQRIQAEWAKGSKGVEVDLDRILGVRAPIGTRLKVMGAWVDPDGTLSCHSKKSGRAEGIHLHGFL